MNDVTLIQSDWLTAAADLIPASIDLLYADPPFNTGKAKTAQAGSYQDSWPTTAAWVGWLEERILASLPALKPTGNLLLHVDWRTSHHVRLLLDRLLGPECFVNHLVWSYGLGGSSPRRFARKHDDILFYAMDPEKYFFEPPMVPATSNRMKGQFKKATDVLEIPPVTDVLMVPSLNNMAAERAGYPTQKPLALLEMLVGACCPAGEGEGAGEGGRTVLDPCFGSGTTLVAAVRTGRRAIGFDRNPEAHEVARVRLSEIETRPL